MSDIPSKRKTDWRIEEMKRLIGELQHEAQTGDFGAVEAIVEAGNHAADVLHYIFACCHPLQRIHRATSMVAEHAQRWPVAIPAVAEIRESAISEALPEMLGESLSVRPKPKGRKSRALTKSGQTRMAFDAFDMLETRRTGGIGFVFGEPWETPAKELPKLSDDSIGEWARVGAMLIRAEIKRKEGLHLLRIPDKFYAAAVKLQAKEGLSTGSAVRSTAEQWLKEGLRQLIGAA
ncbi:MAG: hypothetical protein EOP88_10660 [Verrucomicrobiaceae bacterium]|nr:MAG: hypothetical protein EOP88_10660 [Verrucomicrobiaceae bacterium]